MSTPDWADRLDALEALVIDLALEVARLNAAVRGNYLAEDAAALRRAAVAAEARRAVR